MDKERKVKLVSVTIALALMLMLMAGCRESAQAPTTEEGTPQPPATERALELTGVLTETLNLSAFETGAQCHGAVCRVVDESGVAHSYSGIPLWLLCGRVDDEVKHGSDAFNDELAGEGYAITVIAADGASVTFDSEAIARNDGVIVANKVDGQLLSGDEGPVKLVGLELSGGESIEDIVEIYLDLELVQ